MLSKRSLIVQQVDVWKAYDGVQALQGLNLEVFRGETFGLVGPNGAGKTTLLNTISGLLQVESGSIYFLNDHLDGISTNKIVEKGISQIPEGGKVFPDMSILENLEMGAYNKETWKVRNKTLEYVYSVFPFLKHWKN